MCEQRRSAIAAIFAKGIARCRIASSDDPQRTEHDPEGELVLPRSEHASDEMLAADDSGTGDRVGSESSEVSL